MVKRLSRLKSYNYLCQPSNLPAILGEIFHRRPTKKVSHHIQTQNSIYLTYTLTLFPLLPRLSPKQQEVISLRYGFEDGETHTLEYIARLMRLSVNGVRNIESAALRTLRNPNITLRLRDHLPT